MNDPKTKIEGLAKASKNLKRSASPICVICGKLLTSRKGGRVTCRKECKYVRDKIRLRKRKLDFFELIGGQCEVCGESDLLKLTIHHVYGRDDKTWNANFITKIRFNDYFEQHERGVIMLCCYNCHHAHFHADKFMILYLTKYKHIWESMVNEK